MALPRTLFYFAFATLVVSSFFTDVEAKRKVLQGRKTVTREYYTQSILPPWAKILLIGLGIIFGAALLYFILWKFLVYDLQ
ncbi:Hypothetical protein NTJ_08318 [Nesidiocoris tenuis]|uniref:Uncharacterized protein n=1 Tax=Nesidiocoris tenuis TaxID=355587 RepID=A0ABN7ATI1_9HEMI|nr:Hypothetical protein NTJ_08318 [Nesidiocoris tenuis]